MEKKLTVSDIRLLHAALRRLSDDDVTLPARVRIALALNLRAVQPIVEGFERAARDKLAELSGKGDNGRLREPTTAVAAEVEAALRAEGDRTESVTLRTVKVEELDLDRNPKITAGVIAMLVPILDDLAG